MNEVRKRINTINQYINRQSEPKNTQIQYGKSDGTQILPKNLISIRYHQMVES